MVKDIYRELWIRMKEHAGICLLLLAGTLLLPVGGFFCINGIMTMITAASGFEPQVREFLPLSDRERKKKRVITILLLCFMSAGLLLVSLGIGTLPFYSAVSFTKGIRRAGRFLPIMLVILFFFDNFCSMSVRARKRFVKGREPVYLMVVTMLTELGILYIMLFDSKAGIRVMNKREAKIGLLCLVLVLMVRSLWEITTYWRVEWSDWNSGEMKESIEGELTDEYYGSDEKWNTNL